MSNTEFRTAWLQGGERDGLLYRSFYINMLEIDVSSELPLLRLGAGRGEILSTVLRARVGRGAVFSCLEKTRRCYLHRVYRQVH